MSLLVVTECGGRELTRSQELSQNSYLTYYAILADLAIAAPFSASCTTEVKFNENDAHRVPPYSSVHNTYHW